MYDRIRKNEKGVCVRIARIKSIKGFFTKIKWRSLLAGEKKAWNQWKKQ